MMRTTIDIPDEAHRRLKYLAREQGVSLGALIVELTDRALGIGCEDEPELVTSPVTGLLVFPSTGRIITPEQVKAMLEDDLP